MVTRGQWRAWEDWERERGREAQKGTVQRLRDHKSCWLQISQQLEPSGALAATLKENKSQLRMFHSVQQPELRSKPFYFTHPFSWSCQEFCIKESERGNQKNPEGRGTKDGSGGRPRGSSPGSRSVRLLSGVQWADTAGDDRRERGAGGRGG